MKRKCKLRLATIIFVIFTICAIVFVLKFDYNHDTKNKQTKNKNTVSQLNEKKMNNVSKEKEVQTIKDHKTIIFFPTLSKPF